MLHHPVAAGEGEQVGGGCVAGVQAGDIQDGLAVAHDPAAVLPDGDVTFEKDGLAGAGKARFRRGGQDAQGAGFDPAAFNLAGGGRDGGVLPVQGVERGVQAGLVAEDREQVARVLVLGQPAAFSLVVCIASAVMTTSCRGSGSSSGLKCVVSLALPALASLRSLPSTPTAGRAGRCAGSPVTAGSSHGWPGAARNQPSARTSRSAWPAGARRCRFVPRPAFAPAARAAIRAASCGSSAAGASHAVSPASSSPASSRAGSRSSADA